MKLKLPDSIASSEDLMSVLVEVQNYSRWVAHESVKKRFAKTNESDPPMLSNAAAELIHSWTMHDAANNQILDELISSLKSYIRSASTVNITLAAPPTAQVKSIIVSWFRQNVGHDVLVNFSFNSIILGGMVVRLGSRIFDWSFKRQILANRKKIPEVLRHV